MTHLISLLLFAMHGALAYRGEVVQEAPLMVNQNGRVSKVAVIPAGEQIDVTGRSPKGNYLQATWNGHRGWIAGNAVRASSRRSPAAETSGAFHGGPANDSVALSANGAFHSGQVGLGFGVMGLYHIPTDGSLRWDIGPGIFFFPMAGSDITGSIKVFEIMGVGRMMYSFQKDMEIGAEAGLLYAKFSYSTSPTLSALGVTDVDASSLGVTLGGQYSWRFAQDMRLLAGLRLLVMSGSATMLSAGVEYRL